MKIYDLIIIGAGAAGITSAIYANRMGMEVLIIEKGAPGGKLLNTHIVENYPGLKQTGPEIAMDFFNHAKGFGIEIMQDDVLEIKDFSRVDKLIKTKKGKELKTKTVIIATGMMPRKLELSNYDKFYGNGISTCLICDSALYKGKEIAVIGGGNSALEESLFAVDTVSKIHIININNQPTAFPSITDQALKTKNINIYNNSELIEIKEEKNKISSIIIKNNKTNVNKEIFVEAIFTYIGWISTASFITNKKDKIILNNNGYIITDRLGATKCPGIFAAGDIIEKKYKQVTTAVSDGTIAALSAKKYLDDLKNE